MTDLLAPLLQENPRQREPLWKYLRVEKFMVYIIWTPWRADCPHLLRVLDTGELELTCTHTNFDERIMRAQVKAYIVRMKKEM